MRWQQLAVAGALLALTAAATAPLPAVNVTREEDGDFFYLTGLEPDSFCVAACDAVDAGPALEPARCGCRCRRDTPVYRDDTRRCVRALQATLLSQSWTEDHHQPVSGYSALRAPICHRILECGGRWSEDNETKGVPLLSVPQPRQLLLPSHRLQLTEACDEGVCAVTGAQYLTGDGWAALRASDGDSPLQLYRDEGRLYLQWLGSREAARARGRIVRALALCGGCDPSSTALLAACAAFRVSGAQVQLPNDVRWIPFGALDTDTASASSFSGGAKGVLLASSVTVALLLLTLVALHCRRKIQCRHRRPAGCTECPPPPTVNVQIDADALQRVKSNPLLEAEEGWTQSDHSEHFSDHTQKTTSTNHNQERSEDAERNGRKRTPSPEAVLERAPHCAAIVECTPNQSQEGGYPQQHASLLLEEQPPQRRKLYFNPVFFETELLKNPPPAATEFLTKIREVMAVARERMNSKRFVPLLAGIPEEEWPLEVLLSRDVPCGRRRSVVSLLRDNARKSTCAGCPGCPTPVNRSNSCSACLPDRYKQQAIHRWLEGVPQARNVAKVSGVPRSFSKMENVQAETTEPIKNGDVSTRVHENIVKLPYEDRHTAKAKDKNELELIKAWSEKYQWETDKLEDVSKKMRNSPPRFSNIDRQGLPPPPPPPITPPVKPNDEKIEIPLDIKKKMEAVIRELNSCRRIDSEKAESVTKILTSPQQHFNANNKLIIDMTKYDTNRKMETIKPAIESSCRPNYGTNTISASEVPRRDEQGERRPNTKSPVKVPKIHTTTRQTYSGQTSLATDTPNDDSDRRVNIKKSSLGPKIVIPVTASITNHHKYDEQHNVNVVNTNIRLEEVLSEQFPLNEILRKRKHQLDVKNQQVLVKDPKIANAPLSKEKLKCSWRDVGKYIPNQSVVKVNPTIETIYSDSLRPGPLTIEIKSTPVEPDCESEDFEPDTLERKSRKESKKKIDKILLKSTGSFKSQTRGSEARKDSDRSTAEIFSRKIGSLRQIYEARTREREERARHSFRIDMLPSERTPDLLRLPGRRRDSDSRAMYSVRSRISNFRSSSEERSRSLTHMTARRLRRTRKTEDSGYRSTDSSSPHRPPVEDSDSDSLDDGSARSESGAESVGTDSVFFGRVRPSQSTFPPFVHIH